MPKDIPGLLTKLVNHTRLLRDDRSGSDAICSNSLTLHDLRYD